MRLDVSDITIISWGRFIECEPGDRLHRIYAESHIKALESTGAKYVFVDCGSFPHLPDRQGVERLDPDYSYEAMSKNHALASVTTKYVAFTDWMSLVTKRTLAKTIEHINSEANPDHIILQAFPWELSDFHMTEILKGKLDVSGDMTIAENMSVPYSAPRLPGSSWQVCLTEDAVSINGWNDDIDTCCSVDFHERMRAYCHWANHGVNGEILTRIVPILTGHFRSVRPTDQDQTISPALYKYIETSDPVSLRWRENK